MFKLFITSLIIFVSWQNGVSQITNRTEANRDYRDNYFSSSFDSEELAWTGSVDGTDNVNPCTAGDISDIVKAKLLQRINYFRRMVGVEDQIIFDETLNEKCQEAALMMKANNALLHEPPRNWRCFTDAGFDAARSSNLDGNSVDIISSIDSYIKDAGDINFFVGHRRWIFHSQAKVFGVGQTTNSNVLWVHPLPSNPLISIYNKFIAYPPDGFIPNSLVFDRWSFGIPGAKFLDATVLIKDANDNSIPLTVISTEYEGFADNTIVWEPSGIEVSSCEDVFYNVKISNVELANGSRQDYNYTVKIFQPFVFGDADRDGYVNIKDAYDVSRYAVGLETDICEEGADVNRDGAVNIADAYQIARCAIGHPDSFCTN